MGLRRSNARILDHRTGDFRGWNCARLRYVRRGRRRLTIGNPTLARNLQAVADVDFSIGLDVVGARQSHERNALLVRNSDQALAGRDDVLPFGDPRRYGRPWRRRAGCAGRDVTRDNDALAGPEYGAIAEPVGLLDGGRRHAVFARDSLNRFAATDRHRRTAVPRPMPSRRRRRTIRGHRPGVLGRRRPVSARAMSARCGDRRRPARRRQRLRVDARHRTCRDRAGRILLSGRTVACERVGIETRGVRTTGGGNAQKSGDRHPQPDTRARRHVRTLHVVTHSYATMVDFEIKQQRVNKVLRISESLHAASSPNINVTVCARAGLRQHHMQWSKSHNSCACPGNSGTKRTAIRFSRAIPVCDLVSLIMCCDPPCGPSGKIITPSSAS